MTPMNIIFDDKKQTLGIIIVMPKFVKCVLKKKKILKTE